MPKPKETIRRLSAVLALLCLAAIPSRAQQAGQPDYEAERAVMVQGIRFHAAMAAPETGIPEIDPRVLEVIGEVPRHEFVPEPLRPYAYADTPLPVDEEQHLAMPYLVALMTHLADIRPDDVVFETGTGAGYQAAVLSRLAHRVVSVEVLAPLALQAAGTLKRLGYDNVQVIAADGYYGAPRQAPFDAILVKEAVDHVPPPLLVQLKPGGRLVLPLGPRRGPQVLTVVEKDAEGRISQRGILGVRFTPLQGGERI